MYAYHWQAMPECKSKKQTENKRYLKRKDRRGITGTKRKKNGNEGNKHG